MHCDVIERAIIFTSRLIIQNSPFRLRQYLPREHLQLSIRRILRQGLESPRDPLNNLSQMPCHRKTILVECLALDI